MSLHALVADDEALARDELVYMLRRVGGVGTIEQAASAVEALAMLQETRYDVLFLDIRMPGLSGLEATQVVNRLPHKPQVVFITAFDEYALAAFEVAATDYLVKPVSELRLRRAIERITERRRLQPGARRRVVDKLAVEGEGHTVLVPIADIRVVHVRGHTAVISTFDAEYRSRSSLSELEEQLAAHDFLRVHRAYLVNPEHVLEVHPFFAGAYLLRMQDKHRSEVPVSRALAPRVREAFGL
ncbi:MAG TPA: LytTR family DNA-binding domain-containing protein [Chloroflexota bacterium]